MILESSRELRWKINQELWDKVFDVIRNSFYTHNHFYNVFYSSPMTSNFDLDLRSIILSKQHQYEFTK